MNAEPWLSRFWKHAKGPISLATVAAVIVVARHWATQGQATMALGVSLQAVVVSYFVGALVFGYLLMLGARYMKGRLSGAIAGFCLWAGVVLFLNYSVPVLTLSGLRLLGVMIVFGLVPGAIIGAMYWTPPDRDV